MTPIRITKILTVIAVAAAHMSVVAGDRFVTTLGTVSREISADRVAMTLELTERDSTIEGSIKKLEQALSDFRAHVASLNYPTTALTLKFRIVRTVTRWDDAEKKNIQLGYDASATLSVILVGLTNFSAFLTYVGTHDGYRISWQSMGSAQEGQTRKESIPEALRAARAKAELLAAEGGAKLGKVLEVTEEEVDTREFSGSTWGGNTSDPNAGTGAYPIGIFVRVRAKFELNAK